MIIRRLADISLQFAPETEFTGSEKLQMGKWHYHQ
jgi:hypothetical protein